MRVRDFIGKRVDIQKLQNVSDNFSFPEEIEEGEDYYYEDGQYTKSEIYLSAFEFEGSYDNSGYNFYSLQLRIDGDKIIKLLRIGHTHECNNEGSDDEITRFPYNSLEAEATRYMSRCLLAE